MCQLLAATTHRVRLCLRAQRLCTPGVRTHSHVCLPFAAERTLNPDQLRDFCTLQRKDLLSGAALRHCLSLPLVLVT